jgi:hypothetical protein
LRRDRDSAWVADQAWLSLVRIDTPAGKLTHDLAIDASGANLPSAVQAGYNPVSVAPTAHLVGLHPVRALASRSPIDHDALIVVFAVVATLALGFSVIAVVVGRRRAVKSPA